MLAYVREEWTSIIHYVKMYLLQLKSPEKNNLILTTETEYVTNVKIETQESHKINGRHLQRSC